MTAEAILYEDVDREYWPVPLSQAYQVWVVLLQRFRGYLNQLYEENPPNEREISHVEQFIAGIRAAKAENGLLITDAENRIFEFAALGPYGDPWEVKRLYETYLHPNIMNHDFSQLVADYMHHMAKYNPQYWAANENNRIVDHAAHLLERDSVLSAQIVRIEDRLFRLTHRQRTFAQEHRGQALSREEFAEMSQIEDDITSEQRQLNVLERQHAINARRHAMQVQIEQWVEENMPPRSSGMEYRVQRGNYVYFGNFRFEEVER